MDAGLSNTTSCRRAPFVQVAYCALSANSAGRAVEDRASARENAAVARHQPVARDRCCAGVVHGIVCMRPRGFRRRADGRGALRERRWCNTEDERDDRNEHHEGATYLATWVQVFLVITRLAGLGSAAGKARPDVRVLRRDCLLCRPLPAALQAGE